MIAFRKVGQLPFCEVGGSGRLCKSVESRGAVPAIAHKLTDGARPRRGVGGLACGMFRPLASLSAAHEAFKAAKAVAYKTQKPGGRIETPAGLNLWLDTDCKTWYYYEYETLAIMCI